jgi:retinoid hydroxylase
MVRSVNEAPVAPLDPTTFFSGRMPSEIARVADELGPIFRYVNPYGPDAQRGLVFLVGPEANRFVLHTEREAFSHDLGWTPIIGDVMGHGLLNMDGREWERSRKMWNPAFAQAYMQAYLPLMQRVISERTADWVARGEIDIYDESRAITFTVAATALAGMDRPEQVAHLRELFALLIPHQMIGDDQAYDEFARKQWQAKEELDAILLRIIAERRVAPAEAVPSDVLGLIVRARDDEGLGLADEEVLAHLYILLVAGHETTTTLGAWTLYSLFTMPELRACIEAELRAALGAEWDADTPLTVEATRSLKLLDNFIKEVGRLHSPVLSVPRGVVREVEFGGYVMPVGTPVRLSLSGCHRLARVFADPERFDPDRFAPPREEDRRTPYSLVTFGGGQRLCIGINFANVEVKALAAHVLRHFTLEPAMAETPLDLGFITTIIPSGMPMRARKNAQGGHRGHGGHFTAHDS